MISLLRGLMLPLLLLLALVLPARAENATGSPLRIGISVEAFPGVNINDATAAIKAWTTTVIREHHLENIIYQIDVYDSTTDLKRALTEGRLENAAMSIEEYVRIGLVPDAVLVPAPGDRAEFQYVIIVNARSGITSIRDLSPSDILIFNAPRMNLANAWIRSLIGSRGQAAGNNWIGEPGTANTSKAILQVFFKQAKATLVTRDAFDLACELNPQLGKSLTVIAESPPLIASLMMFRPDWHGKFRNTFEEALLHLQDSPGGKQILTIHQSARMARVPTAELQPSVDFVKKYVLQ